MPEKFFTPDEVAEYLKVSPQTIRYWIRHKKLKAVRLGRVYRIPTEEVQRVTTEGITDEDSSNSPEQPED